MKNIHTTKGDLARHKRGVHEGVKYPCDQCKYQVTYKGHLAQHRRTVHEVVRFP